MGLALMPGSGGTKGEKILMDIIEGSFLFAASDGAVLGVALLGLLVTGGGFLGCQRLMVLSSLSGRSVPVLISALRLLCMVGAVFFALCLLGLCLGPQR